MNVIEATGLRKRFGTTQALDGVDLAAREGTVLGVLGPNGAGKTTAVRVLATLLRPDAGSARVGGYDVATQAEQVRATIGLTGQYASVDEDLTGTQNLVMIGQLLDLTRRQAKSRAAELLEWFDLTAAARKMAKTYSGGMRRRLDLAASLVGRPAVIFLDEPTTGLDPAKREDMWAVIRNLVTEGSTVLLTTQYLEEADALADEISVIDHGRVIAHDSPEGLKRIVGGQRIAVRPTDPDRLAEVASVLAQIGTGVPEASGGSQPGALGHADGGDDRAVHGLHGGRVTFAQICRRLLQIPVVGQALHHSRGRQTDALDVVQHHRRLVALAQCATQFGDQQPGLIVPADLQLEHGQRGGGEQLPLGVRAQRSAGGQFVQLGAGSGDVPGADVHIRDLQMQEQLVLDRPELANAASGLQIVRQRVGQPAIEGGELGPRHQAGGQSPAVTEGDERGIGEVDCRTHAFDLAGVLVQVRGGRLRRCP